jgi:hypothetical protein
MVRMRTLYPSGCPHERTYTALVERSSSSELCECTNCQCSMCGQCIQARRMLVECACVILWNSNSRVLALSRSLSHYL